MYYAGLDLGLKKTAACIVDEDDKILRQGNLDSDPETIALWLHEQKLPLKRVGIESGMMHEYIYFGLVKAGLPAIVINSVDSRTFLKSKINKTDKSDAHGIARMMRMRHYKEVYVKTEESQRQRVLLASRKLAHAKMRDTETHIRGIIRQFGFKMGTTSRAKFEARVRELVEHDANLLAAVEPMLALQRAAREQFNTLSRRILTVVRTCPVCQILMTCPGVGPIGALMFKTTIDTPTRFRNAKAVGAALGLTPRRWESGETQIMGRISRVGDGALRSVLYEGAQSFLAMNKRPCWLHTWAQELKEKKGHGKAVVALARKIAMILYVLWIEWRPFRWDDQPVA
jgi:transposase